MVMISQFWIILRWLAPWKTTTPKKFFLKQKYFVRGMANLIGERKYHPIFIKQTYFFFVLSYIVWYICFRLKCNHYCMNTATSVGCWVVTYNQALNLFKINTHTPYTLTHPTHTHTYNNSLLISSKALLTVL